MQTLKKIIMILVLLLSLGGLIFSIISIKNNLTDNKIEVNTSENIPMESGEIVPKKNMEIIDYSVIALFSFTFSLALIYMISSRFNNKKDVSNDYSKKILFILEILVLSSVITFVSSLIINDRSNIVPNKKENKEITYTGSTLINKRTTENKKEYFSNKANESALLVNGSEVHINNSSLTKEGNSTDLEASNFYGINSSILAYNKAQLFIDNMTINSNASGGNAVFSFGSNKNDGTKVTITNSRIKTEKDNSGGIMVAGGGLINAINLNVETAGQSSAAIRSDRGGGNIDVNIGTYKTTGIGSPVIYSTANINVTDATLISEASEGIIIEGANSVNLNKVTLVDTNNKLNGKSTTYKNIFIYQSMSGDSIEGTATFKCDSSNITTNKGDTIYVTNTKAVIELSNNTFVNNDQDGAFLRVQKDSWGRTGSNGGDVTLNLDNENIVGDIVVDSLSTLNMSITNSKLEIAINNKNEAKSIILNVDKNSTIKLTGDTYITELKDEDNNYSNIDFNGYKLYVNNIEIKGA